jgi:hypothetical protein
MLRRDRMGASSATFAHEIASFLDECTAEQSRARSCARREVLAPPTSPSRSSGRVLRLVCVFVVSVAAGATGMVFFLESPHSRRSDVARVVVRVERVIEEGVAAVAHER